MYQIAKKKYPNTIVWQHATDVVIHHDTFLICETPKRTPIYSASGHKLSESIHRLAYIPNHQYFNVWYSRTPEEQISIHFSTPYWMTGQTIQFVDYDVSILVTNRSLVIDDIDLWQESSWRYPEQDVRHVLLAISKTVEQLVQDRFAPLDLLRDVYSRL
ncbi:hypothetical protein LSG31_08015 [Fodinisporobacter ferrooxydans]|uniref:DUF402 domain-containing protein n=1 Tax=Fodinisporobacter ferrooxydans TaxID=2901836 RepID=A0ABY4CW55_9BACL|nr:hypothetical protein LSG31_08015 [Alicyclobacillaceae bacterium MYW30-H2]